MEIIKKQTLEVIIPAFMVLTLNLRGRFWDIPEESGLGSEDSTMSTFINPKWSSEGPM
jgi:hypothetical protein